MNGSKKIWGGSGGLLAITFIYHNGPGDSRPKGITAIVWNRAGMSLALCAG